MATPDIQTQLSGMDPRHSEAGTDAIRNNSWSQLLSRSACKSALYLLGDLAAMLAAYRLAKLVAQKWLAVPAQYLVPSHYYLLYLPLVGVVLYFFSAYRSHDLRRPEKELELVCKAATLSFLALVAGNFAVFKTGFSRYFVVSWYLLSLPALLAVRFSLRGLYVALWKRGLAQQRVLLLGSQEELMRFNEALALQRHKGYRVAGVLDLAGADGQEGGLRPHALAIQRVQRWQEHVSAAPLDLIVISSPSLSRAQDLALEMLPYCRERGIELEVYSDLFGSSEFQYELDEFSGCFRFRAKPFWGRRLQKLLKALIDRVIGLVGSIVTLLITPWIAAVIKLDGGPIFYRSAYLGQDGKNHYYLKFRTMCVDADHLLARLPQLRDQFERKFKLESDPRVTRAGRFLRKYSLDEFPQFFSVLLGKLSFVGPRTIRQEEGLRYGPLLPRLLSFKPGVTGFWQVMGRQTTSYEERIQMDMFYIDHWSLWLDLVIMAKTVWKIIKTEGAY